MCIFISRNLKNSIISKKVPRGIIVIGWMCVEICCGYNTLILFHMKLFSFGRGCICINEGNSFHVEQMSVSLVNKIICISTWNIDTY